MTSLDNYNDKNAKTHIEHPDSWHSYVFSFDIEEDATATLSDSSMYGEFAEIASVKVPSAVASKSGRSYPVKKIGKLAFSSCGNLRQIIIPEGIEEVCDFAFSSCDSLAGVVLPSSLKKIGEAFWDAPQYEAGGQGIIRYAGTKEQWEELLSNSFSDELENSELCEKTVIFADPSDVMAEETE